jgi:predicted RND superfamily exporter protein/2-polyprenyl-3-methyl-5-hydroxy-6-metoxy-1,4-benzoquinol methylase
MNRIVVVLYEFFKARKAVFYSVLIGLFIILGYFASRISLQEDITKMIPDDKETEGYKSAIQNIRILDKIIVSFNADSAGMEDSLIGCAEKFVTELNAQAETKSLITDVRFSIDEERIAGVYDLLYNNLPIYLTPEDYKRIDTITTEAGVKENIERDYHKLVSPASLILKQYILKDPLSVSSSAMSKLQGMQAEDSYELYNGYIFRKNKKTLVIFITPKHAPNKTNLNGPLVDLLDHTVEKSQSAYKQFNVNYFGAAAVAVSNARQIEKDIKIIATVALLFILVFLYLFYRSWSLPFLMISPIIFGGLFSLSMIYFIQGAISAIAIGAGSVIIGIALDYSYHVFAHYQHTRSIKAVVNDIAVPMMIGSISTVGAFFSLLYVHSDILSDFGLFAGLCLIGASLFALIFLPHLIETFSTIQGTEHQEKERKSESFIMKFIGMKPETNKWFVLVVLMLTAVFVYFSNRVSFDSDLSQINYMSKELKAAEDALYQNDTTKGKSVFLIFKGKDLSEALYRNEEALVVIDSLKKQDIVHRYAGISSLLPSDSIQLKRIAYWKAYWTPEKIAQVEQYISKYALELGFRPEAFNPFFESLKKDYLVMNASDRTFMQQVFLKDYIQSDSNGVAVIASMRLPTAISSDVYLPFNKIEGLTILDRQLFYNKFLLIVKDDFNQILMSSSLLVFMILLISYGRMELSLISFIPMLVSWFWILGLMGILDIHFNIVNIIISTFVFGLGDDYSIFFTDGLQKKYAEGKDNLPSYKVSVFLSAFTTIVAMGALIFAKHPALKSIAVISIIGIACVVVISYTLIPLLFKWVITDRTEQGRPPLTLVILLRTIIYTALAVLLVCVLTLIKEIFIVLSIFISTQSSRKIYKFIVHKFCKIALFVSFFMKKNIPALTMDFDNKAVLIVSTDQSALNQLILLSLHSKIVLIRSQMNTYSWFEKVIFFVQDLGKNNAADVEHEISIAMAAGFSPVLFMKETTGHFELPSTNTFAEVLPVLIVGSENCLFKNDTFLNRGFVHVQILPYLSAQESTTEKINTVYREGYKKLHASLPMATFFNRILSSYIYKGPILEWYFRIKVGLENSYQGFNDLLPAKGKIYDLGCGYGFLDYYLMLQSDERTIIGVDYDEEKIQVANHSYLKNDRLTFMDNDVMKVQVKDADAVLILDVLHYLSADNQCRLIRSTYEGLRPGGILIIRDGDCSQVSKHNGTKLTEFFSTKLLKFNKQTEQNLCFISSETIIKTLSDFNVEVKVVDTTVYTSNIIYYVVKQ